MRRSVTVSLRPRDAGRRILQPHFAGSAKVPALALRPKREAEIDSVKAQLAELDSLGFATYVSNPGVHGSSMLVDSRSGGSTEATWKVVLDFLSAVISE